MWLNTACFSPVFMDMALQKVIYMKIFLLSLLIYSSFATVPVFALDDCTKLILSEKSLLSEINPDPVEQWLLWEELANVEYFHQPTAVVRVPAVKKKYAEVKLTNLGKISVRQRELIQDGQDVTWFQHPLNLSKKVPFSDETATHYYDGRYTASRSVVILDPETKKPLISVKLPTNLVHVKATRASVQDSKADTTNDIDGAQIQVPYMLKRHSETGVDQEMIILMEIATVTPPNSHIGYSVRDLRPLLDGNYYVPALSIPFVGHIIAEKNGVSFAEFWKENYAGLLGNAKARLLLKYGFEMVTPNAQNMLVQLDKDLRPTGKIVFRDVVDANMVDFVAGPLGQESELKRNKEHEYPIRQSLKPYWENSSWRFDEGGVENEVLKDWHRSHDLAYATHIYQELGFNVDLSKVPTEKLVTSVEKFLKSEEGQRALKKYEKKQREKQQKGKIAFMQDFPGREVQNWNFARSSTCLIMA